MKLFLLRLAFTLCLLLTVSFGISPPANACPRAVTLTYYAWVAADNPSFYHWCTYPPVGLPPPPGYLTWQAVGGETTDCDGNYSSWGDITNCTGSGNTVRTSTACTCSS
jgi:hypothetical protein